MANPNPSPATRFKKGNPGGPGGYSNKRRFTDGLLKLIEEKGAEPHILALWLRKILKDEDFRYFNAMLERVEGKLLEKLSIEDATVVVERKDRKRKRKGAAPKRAPRRPPRRPGEGQG